MNLSVVDACFPLRRQSYGLAALWIRWHSVRRGARVVPSADADVICATCVDPRQWTVIKSLRNAYPGKRIVAGGAGALSPYSLGLWADAVCVGNGERFLNTLISDGYDAASALPESWVDGETRSVEVASGFPWRCPPIQSEDGAYRVWCGRGCKRKCTFCHTGWGVQYEENPDPRHLMRSIGRLQKDGKRVAYLSNDPNQHSFADQLPPVDSGSYTFDTIKKGYIPSARQVRIGVEGVSEHLRKTVGKPIGHDDLVKSAAWLNSKGKSVRWFMIAGLPGESSDDWDELRAAVMDWKRICSKGVLALSFTAWLPEPSTPLGIAPVDDAYWPRYEAFREWFFSGVGWSNRVKLMNPCAPASRMKSAVARMGLSESELRKGGSWGPNDRVFYPHKKARNKKAKT